ncbi:MAG: TIGR03663 family protein, partial [Candidatus Omnitrophica bacterium]|nr:TIGR03663 family protein [Candidatus Omnitrophota bacterium]
PLRLPQLSRRPMHTDESVQAIKFRGLLENGVYRYDPNEYHGPTLAYATLPAAWLSGARNLAQTNESTFRVVPVLFGIGLVLLLWLVRDGLGGIATFAAGILTAISPAMVFYSRYYIHEMLLVFFTFLLMAAIWRYTRQPRLGWALLAGASLGLMQATKETFAFAIGAGALAVVLTVSWRRLIDKVASAKGKIETGGNDPVLEEKAAESVLTNSATGASRCNPPDEGPSGPHSTPGLEGKRSSADPFRFRAAHGLAALAVAVGVSVLLFSSFFTNPSGPLDSVRTYLPWLSRAGGQTPHVHPWHYYFDLLAFTHRARGPVWSEGLILGLALVGMIAGLARRGLGGAKESWVRFVTFYTLLLTVIYSLIPYKTPWCMLGFLHGMILLAGVGASVVIRAWRHRAYQAIAALVLVIAAGQLTVQACRTSFTYYADQRNPYVYAHTAPDLLRLIHTVQQLARIDPRGDQMIVQVMAKNGDYWPLPWYFRRFKSVGWWDRVPPHPRGAVIIASPAFDPALEKELGDGSTMTGFFALRPSAFLELFVQADLWQAYLKSGLAAEE